MLQLTIFVVALGYAGKPPGRSPLGTRRVSRGWLPGERAATPPPPPPQPPQPPTPPAPPAVVSPIILPFASLYFLLTWPVWRYQLLYVYQGHFSAGGQFWIYCAHRIVVCLGVMASFTAGEG